LLLTTVNKKLPADITLDLDINHMSADDRKAEIIKVVTKYYNLWEPPPNPATRMNYLEKELLPKASAILSAFHIVIDKYYLSGCIR
jgi:hypothetical protein